jgi:hypothetical protein
MEKILQSLGTNVLLALMELATDSNEFLILKDKILHGIEPDNLRKLIWKKSTDVDDDVWIVYYFCC